MVFVESTLVLTDNGEVFFAGELVYKPEEYDIRPVPISPVYKFTKIDFPARVISVAAGEAHCLAALDDGTLWSWGHNEYGELGLSSPGAVSLPTPIPNTHNFISVAGGGHCSYGLDHQEHLWSWGRNNAGQLGTGDQKNRNVPTRLEKLKNIKVIASGYDHCLVMDASDQVWGFGDSATPDLELGPDPVRIVQHLNIVQICAGTSFSALLDSDRRVWVFGYFFCEVGTSDGRPGFCQGDLGLSVVNGLPPFARIWASGNGLYGQTDSGQVWVYGGDIDGELALGDSQWDEPHGDCPILSFYNTRRCPALDKMVGIFPGCSHMICVDNEGFLYGCGDNYHGQLGLGKEIEAVTVPTPIEYLRLFSKISPVKAAR